MANNNSSPFQLNGRWTFLQQFFRHPFQVASVIPSSRFLERRVVEAADVSRANLVVELGPGNGGTTRALLAAMPAHGRLLSIELNPHLHALQADIGDDRLIAHLGSACDLGSILVDYGLETPDAVVSGIPFSTMSPTMGSGILESVSAALAPNGRFVAYQWSNRVDELCQPILGPARSVTEIRNIPPMRVYQWQNARA